MPPNKVKGFQSIYVISFSSIPYCSNSDFLGNKTVEQRLGANLKKNIFLINFTPNLQLFFVFFQLYSTKNAENDYFNQHFECAAPKHWLKYTTIQSESIHFILALWVSTKDSSYIFLFGAMSSINLCCHKVNCGCSPYKLYQHINKCGQSTGCYITRLLHYIIIIGPTIKLKLKKNVTKVTPASKNGNPGNYFHLILLIVKSVHTYEF